MLTVTQFPYLRASTKLSASLTLGPAGRTRTPRLASKDMFRPHTMQSISSSTKKNESYSSISPYAQRVERVVRRNLNPSQFKSNLENRSQMSSRDSTIHVTMKSPVQGGVGNHSRAAFKASSPSPRKSQEPSSGGPVSAFDWTWASGNGHGHGNGDDDRIASLKSYRVSTADVTKVHTNRNRKKNRLSQSQQSSVFFL